jgi:DNA-binding CsgD family transcriptional regulator
MGQRGRPRHPDVLTPREQDVLALIRDGLTNEQIAERLGISFETAKSHVAEILSKFGVATREEAAAWHPETPRQQRKASGWAMVTTSFALMAAAGVGVVLLAWDVWRSGGNDGNVSHLPAALSSSSCLLDPATSSIGATASIDWTSRAVNLIEGSSDVELLSGSL